MDLSETIEETFKGMQAVAENLSLKGEFQKTIF